MSPTTSGLILAFAAILTLAFVAAGLLARVHALEQAIGIGPDVGSSRPASRPDGVAFRPDGRPVVLVIASPTCRSCGELVPRLGGLLDLGVDVRVLWEGAPGGAVPDGVATVVVDRADTRAAGATATPYALIVDTDGTVRWSGAIADIHRLIDLTATTVTAPQEDTSP